MIKEKESEKKPAVINNNFHCLGNCLSSLGSLLLKVDVSPKLSPCLPQVNPKKAEA